MKLLKQKGSNVLYVWDKDLALRDDMEEFVKAPLEPVQKEQVEEVQDVVQEVAEIAETPVKTAKKKGK